MDFTHDGKTAISVCHNDSHLKIWNLEENPELPIVYDIGDPRLTRFSIIRLI